MPREVKSSGSAEKAVETEADAMFRELTTTALHCTVPIR
jgi:hypothetical protein